MAETHLELKQGATQTIEIPDVKDANGALINPAGCTVRAQIRDTKFSATFLHEWTSATITTGKVVLDLAAATSVPWTWSTGRYDVELIDGAGKVGRIAEGPVSLNREVTR